MRLFLALLMALSLSAESRWTTKAYRASVAAVAAASIADAATSLGKGESNPALRSPGGTFGARGIAIKSAIVGASAGIGWLATRHRSRAIPAIANCGMAGVYGAIALRNSKLR